jgi:hypothetical protein
MVSPEYPLASFTSASNLMVGVEFQSKLPWLEFRDLSQPA